MNYLEKLSPSMAEVCQRLWKLTSAKCEWTWNTIITPYMTGHKNMSTKNATMTFYNEKQQLYLETSSRICLGASLLQVRDEMGLQRNEVSDNALLQPIAFTSKILRSAESHYSNIELAAVCI